MFSVVDNSDERRGVKRKMSLACCDVCETEEAKYRCPNCLKHTCSLACVKQHKMSSGCCGVRDKTAFVTLAQFNEMNLLSDYRFLEDTARLRQRSNRDSVLNTSRQHPKQKMWLVRKARAAKVTLKILPKMFSKHRENRTIFRRVDGRFYWHLKIHFPQSSAVFSDRFADNRELSEILQHYIHPSESDAVTRQRLKVYVHSPQENIKVFMKSEQTQPNSLRYHELDSKKTLGENLMSKTVVEYPELYVVLKPHSQEYLTQRKERSSAASGVESGVLSRTSASTEGPESEASTHVAKRTKVIFDGDELEDGEIRSEEEDEDDDGVMGNLNITEKTAPESDRDSESDDEDDESDEEETLELHVEMKSKASPHSCVLDTEGDIEIQHRESTAENIHSRTEETVIVSQSLGDVGGRGTTETLSRLVEKDPLDSTGVPQTHAIVCSGVQCEDSEFAVSPHASQQDIVLHTLEEEDCVHDRNDDEADVPDREEEVETQYGSCQTSVGESQDLSGAHASTCGDESQENTPRNVAGGNASIDASDSHICASVRGKGVHQGNIHDGSGTEDHSPTDVQREAESRADVGASVGGENANANSHIPAVAHSEGLRQDNVCDSVGVENANVCASESHAATDAHSDGRANIRDGVSDVSAHVSYQTVCETEPRV